jgi:DNA-3-methyladenine glycosylase I
MAQQPSPCRCPWVDLAKADYVAYHDQEWGVPIYDDRRLFEFLVLEAAQAGLSWYTVLRKRDHYCRAFADFDPARVAQYTEADIATLLQNPGIIRHRQKILAAITNAQRFLDVQAAFGSFAAYIWRFVDHTSIVHTLRTLQDYPATSPESDALSKDLRQRGFKFVGSTICYAHMQATGMVNDHTIDCFRRQQIIDGYTNTTPSGGMGPFSLPARGHPVACPALPEAISQPFSHRRGAQSQAQSRIRGLRVMF